MKDGCTVCEIYRESPKVMIKEKYVIVNDGEILKSILTKHATRPDGCASCIKNYMKENLFLTAQKYYNHSRFNVIEVVDDGHLYYEVMMRCE